MGLQRVRHNLGLSAQALYGWDAYCVLVTMLALDKLLPHHPEHFPGSYLNLP